MIELAKVDPKGKSTGKIKVREDIFGIHPNQLAVSQTVRVYLSNQRQVSAKSKTRGEVSGSGKKIWRQKGTGKARHGDRYAPIFVGGGIAHGPRGNQNFGKNISKKMKRIALFSVLSQKVKENHCVVVENFEKLEPKTKNLKKAIDQVIDKEKEMNIKPGLVTTIEEVNIRRASRNIKDLMLISAETINAYEVLNVGIVLMTPKALEIIELRNGKNEKKSTDKNRKITTKRPPKKETSKKNMSTSKKSAKSEVSHPKKSEITQVKKRQTIKVDKA